MCIDIKVGEATNFVITEKNELYGWGYNKNFLLLNNDVLAEISPKKIVELGDIKVQQIAISKIQATVLSTEGQLYGWGCYLAREGRRILYKQVNLTQLSSSFFFEIESSWNSYHTIALGHSNILYGMGGNHYGQLTKFPRRGNKKIPISAFNFIHKLVKLDTNNKKIKRIKVIENNTIIITNDNKMYMCGDNTHGELNYLERNNVFKVKRNTFLKELNNGNIAFNSNFVEINLGNDSIKDIKCDDKYYYLIDNYNFIYKWKFQQQVEISKLDPSIMSVDFFGRKNKRKYMLSHKATIQ